MVEIKEERKNKIKFLEIDDAIYKNDSEMYYYKEPIYIIQWKNIKDASLSYGIIKDMNKSKILYLSQLNSSSKLSLIFNLSNNKLIGKHNGLLGRYKQGNFFKILINKFISQSNTDNKYNQLPNEINISIKVDKEDINKNIYFLDNYAFIDNENNEHFHDNLKELNELYTKLYINNKEYKYKKYFIPEKEGEYNIILKFYIY